MMCRQRKQNETAPDLNFKHKTISIFLIHYINIEEKRGLCQYLK